MDTFAGGIDWVALASGVGWLSGTCVLVISLLAFRFLFQPVPLFSCYS